ncbi:hypothetical protein FLONG3_11099 [Fusarium longipes]|uniref:Apple domain-containing protein n=1 Tax=Fusarium longipes TaxID=694270 RepID=A0A395RI56_9HYPO|nr:hypothetical protein FLONG3_11099 [Fusarium longipes]
MRSVSALVALAIAGSFELATASKCKPSSPPQVDTTAQSVPITTGTATKSIPASETTEGPVIITNAVTNGDFGGYDPSADGGIYAFQAGGSAKLLQGPGHVGQNEERNCVQLRTSLTRKRQTPPENPWIQQKLEELEPSDYTVRFWYAIVTNAVADTCRIEGFYGGERFGATPYFPVISDAADQWMEFVNEMPVTTNSGMIRFELVCVNGGSAEAYFDQVFVSNKIGDEWVDGISLFFPTSKHAATIGPAQTSTALPIDTAVTSSSDTETSDVPTSQPAEAPTTMEEASTTGKTTDAVPTSTASAAPTGKDDDEVTPSGPKVCAKLGAGASGRGCAKRPYSSKQGYKRFGGSKITKEQCAALCLADTKCLSFEWLYQGSGCANTCNLLATELTNAPISESSDAAWAYDRSCIQEDECSEQPAGTVCVNVNADTPAKSCTQLQGVAKACAKPFLTAPTRGLCGLTNECRDLCAKYPSCKSYSATFGSCSLYDARSSEVAEPANAYSFFYDMDCHACGAGNAYFDYIARGQDPDNMPKWTCPAKEQKTSSTLAVSTTAQPAVITTSSVEATTTAGPTENDSAMTTSSPSSTTASSPSTTLICPSGVPSPGLCSSANPVPSKALCGKRGWPQLTDAWGYGLDDRPNQRSVEDCALICKTDHGCLAFGFDDSQPTLKCALISSDLEDASIDENSGSNAIWYDMKCMDCQVCGEKEASSTPSPPELGCTALSTNAGCRYKENGEWPIGNNGRGVAGYTCHSNGKVTLGEPFSADTTVWPRQNSEIQCTETCLQLENCKSSAYNRDTLRCEFLSTSLQDAGYRFRDGSNVWYNDNACFDCSGLCREPPREVPTGTESVPFFPPTEAPTTMRTSTRSADEEIATRTTSAVSNPATTTSSASQNEPTTCAAPLASLSDSVTCGIPGVSNAAQSKQVDGFAFKVTGTLEKCALECLQLAECKGFVFQKDTTMCNVFTAGTSGLEVVYHPPSADRFYDRNCFKCGSG